MPEPTRKQKLKRLAWILGVASILVIFGTVYLVHYYGATRPTVADPQSGRTHPAKIHERTVYLTETEYALAWSTHVLAVVGLGVFLGMALKAKFAK